MARAALKAKKRTAALGEQSVLTLEVQDLDLLEDRQEVGAEHVCPELALQPQNTDFRGAVDAYKKNRSRECLEANGR
ncbi:hypothetical protein PsyrH_22845 [Pseudomonas syringae pv. syringae HS191]|nr:hypothetical protein PsyrH_22845 [Pseudomonas syringae pv. syringae HS191]RML73056.1 hypothetical protein ALQ91_200201 [Pseudomonas syringae pv. syringae]